MSAHRSRLRSCLVACAATAVLGAVAAAPANAGWHELKANNVWTDLGWHSVDSMYIDYQGGGSFTTCGALEPSPGSTPYGWNCGTLDAFVLSTPGQTCPAPTVTAFARGRQSDNSAHNVFVTWINNWC